MARLSIGDLARHTGCRVETIRYYERIGLLPAPPRTAGGQRAYAPSHLKRLTFVCRGRALGMTLEEIRALLGLVESGDYRCAQVHAVALRHLDDVRRKIAELQRLERTFEALARRCEQDETPTCPIVDILFDEAQDDLTGDHAAPRG